MLDSIRLGVRTICTYTTKLCWFLEITKYEQQDQQGESRSKTNSEIADGLLEKDEVVIRSERQKKKNLMWLRRPIFNLSFWT